MSAHERALAGAAILDHAVARLLLSELDEDGFEDPTARLVFRVLREGKRVEESFYSSGMLDEDLPEPPPGWVEPTDLEDAVAGLVRARRRGHSRKPDEMRAVVERCSPGPRLELFGREVPAAWSGWGLEARRPSRR